MKLILKLTLRDLKNARGFAALFIFNLSLGLLGFIVLHSFKNNINTTLENRSKILLASDITITGRRNITDDEKKHIDAILLDKVLLESKMTSLYSMAKVPNRTDRNSRLVQIKFIKYNYPLYGHIKLQKQNLVTDNLLKKLESKPLVWISKELAFQLKLEIGNKLTLGDITFTVDDILEEDTTTSWRGVGLAPKLYASQAFANGTKLISFGSIAGHSHQYRLKEQYSNSEESDLLQKSLLSKITDPALRVLLPKNQSEQVGRVLNYLADYLGLVSLIAVFLSGIGSAYLFQNYIFQRLDEIGILKSLGMKIENIRLLFLFQITVMGLFGTLTSISLAHFVLPTLSVVLTELLAINVNLQITFEAVLIAIMVGALVNILVCYPILRKLLSRKTTEMFSGERSFRWKWTIKDILLYLPLVLGSYGMAIWQSHSLIVGTIFSSALIIIGLIVGLGLPYFLSFVDRKFIKNSKSLHSPINLALGFSLRSLLRNRLATTLSFLALSFGVMLLSLISQLESSLSKELLDSPTKKPSLFLFDIQEEQKDDLVKYAIKKNIPLIDPVPMIRARITKIKGNIYQREKSDKGFRTREEEQKTRFRNRGINITYGLKTNYSQVIVEGEEFKGSYIESNGQLPEVSLEKRYAKRLKVGIGETISFEVLGVEVQARVTSLRKVKWTTFVPNFFITLQPGVLEDAPKTYLAAIGQMDFEKQLQAQDAIVDKFGNISIINVSDLVKKILKLFTTMGIAIKLMAILCIIVGLFVIYAILQNQLRKREYDQALQKILGMDEKTVKKTLVFEYTIVAFFASVIGCVFSLILGNVLSKVFFDGVWSLDVVYLFSIVIGMVLFTYSIVKVSAHRVYKKSARLLLE